MAAKFSSSLHSQYPHYTLTDIPVLLSAYGNHSSKEDKGRRQWLQYAVDRFILNREAWRSCTFTFREGATMVDECKKMMCYLVHKVLHIKEPQTSVIGSSLVERLPTNSLLSRLISFARIIGLEVK